MTSIILATIKTKGYIPFYLVMDEHNCLSYATGNGRRYMINNKPIPNVLVYQLAEEFAAVFPDRTTVHWLFDVHKKKLECIAREKGKDRDNVYRFVVAEAMVREMQRNIKTHDDLKRRVSMEVRFLPLLIENPTENDKADIVGTVEDIGKLTPKEMAQMFPAEKRYDGKGDFKDYFTSTKFLNSLENKPMGTEGALHFMWDYMNPELDRFNMLVMDAVDNDRREQGKPSMGEEFAKKWESRFIRKQQTQTEILFYFVTTAGLYRLIWRMKTMTNINHELDVSIENFIKRLAKYPQEKQISVFKTAAENIYEAGKSSGKREAQSRKEARI